MKKSSTHNWIIAFLHKYNHSVVLIIFVCVILTFGVSLVKATVLIKTIPVGNTQPGRIAVDSIHHRAYVMGCGLICGVDNTLTVLDTQNDTIVTTLVLDPHPIGGPAVNSQTRRVYIPTSNQTGDSITVLDGETNTVITTISGGFMTPTDVAVNEITNRIYVTNNKGGGQLNPGFVIVIDGTTNTVIGNIPVGSDPRSVAVNPVTNRIYVPAAGNDPGLTIIDGATNTITENLSLAVSVTSIAIDTGLNHIFVTNHFGGDIFVVDGNTNSVIEVISIPHGAGAITVDSRLHRAYVTNFGAPIISIIDTQTNTVIEQLNADTAPNTTAQFPDVDYVLGKLYVPLNNLNLVAVLSTFPPNQQPFANPNGPYLCTIGVVCNFDSSGSYDPDSGNSITLYEWDFDYDGITFTVDASGQALTNPTWIYSDKPFAKTLALRVTDNHGATSPISVATVTILYNFKGFYQPVDNLPTLNSVKAGQAIPIKFSLSGNQGMNIFAEGYPTSTSVTCGSTAEDAIEEIVTAGSSGLTYDPNTGVYIYVWKTDKAWAGTCRTLIVKLNDGSYHRANFKFK